MLRKKAESHGPAGHSPDSHPKPHEPKHHTRYLLEEAAGAYALGKELLGDRKNHVTHLVAEAVGATGLIKDLRDRSARINA